MHAQKSEAPSRFFVILSTPWIDKAIAFIAALPWLFFVIQRVRASDFDIPRAALTANSLLIVVPMLIRHTPRRISNSFWHWLIGFLGTYLIVFVPPVLLKGRPVAPTVIADGISLISLVIIVYARLSLWRNIGFIPAQRNIVVTGAYRFVRHPIYTGFVVSTVAFNLSHFSLFNAALAIATIGLTVARSFHEEDFLREDPDYAAYLDRVKWRWFPGLF